MPRRSVTDPDKELERLDKLAGLLDTAIGIPGTRFSIGLDGLAGLIPGIGDTATLAASLWIVYQAGRLGAPTGVVARMLLNVGLDYAIGLVPVAGDLFDIAWKANRRNVRLLRTALGRDRMPGTG